MKLKSTLLSLAVAVAFTMPIDAAQYTVPEGQPPVPGADASIPDTDKAYFFLHPILYREALFLCRIKQAAESLYHSSVCHISTHTVCLEGI